MARSHCAADFPQAGEQIVHSTPLYGGTETLIRRILPEWGIAATRSPTAVARADGRGLAAAAARGRVGLFYIETPANPTNALIDLAAVRAALDDFAGRHGYRPVAACDNTLLGPIFQHPIRDGIDLSIYSLTKYVGGHSDLVAGGVTGRAELIQKLRLLRGAFGSQLDPHSSWMIARSMETLILRMRRAAATASRIAHWLADNPVRRVKVLHPQLIAEPAYQEVYRRSARAPARPSRWCSTATRATAFRFINALTLFKSAVSLGGTESLVCHPASPTTRACRSRYVSRSALARAWCGCRSAWSTRRT